MKLKTLFAFLIWSCLILATALVVPTAAQDDADPQPSEQPNVARQVAVSDTTVDEAIESRLNSVLRATTWVDEVDVEVRDSVAFLRGVAPDADRRTRAAELARNTEGVAAVVNEISVKRVINLSETFTVVMTSVNSLWEDFLAQSPLIVAGLLALLATALVSRLAHAVASRVARRSRVSSSLQDLFLQLMNTAIWLVGLLLAAIIMFPGMTPSKALAVLGLGSVAVGFAFKDIFENFFAGVLILWKYPFDRGDFIECGDIRGRIENISIRMSMIRQVDGQLVVVPNAMLFKNPVDVLTNQQTRRTTVICGVAYDTDLDEAQRVIKEAVAGCETVDRRHPIEVFAQALADSSVNFEVTWWTGSTPLEIRESRDEVVRAVKRALDEAQIEIPFPQRTLWMPDLDAKSLATASEATAG